MVEARCPKDVPTREGYSFDCTIAFEGGAELVVTVKQLGGSRLHWTTKEPVVWVKDAEIAVLGALAERGHEVMKVRCSEPIFLTAGSSMTCEAPGEGGHVHRATYSLSADGEKKIRFSE